MLTKNKKSPDKQGFFVLKAELHPLYPDRL